jgi:hypothetical protein
MKTSASSFGFDPTRVTQLSWTPRVFLYEGFLSDEECDHFIKLVLNLKHLYLSFLSSDDDDDERMFL